MNLAKVILLGIETRPCSSYPVLVNTELYQITYKVSQEESSVFWEVTAPVILSKKVHICPTPNGFRNRAISLYRRATRHVLTRVAKCIEVEGGIFENVLY
jgi:hypothetical protein